MMALLEASEELESDQIKRVFRRGNFRTSKVMSAKRETKSGAYYTVSQDGSGEFDNLKTAIDCLPSTGGTIFIKDGNYTQNTITMKSNVKLEGSGKGTAITLAGETSGHYGSYCLKLESCLNVTIKNCKIVFTGTIKSATDAGGLISMDSSTAKIFFQNVLFSKSGAMNSSVGFFGNGDTTTASNVVIQGCEFINENLGNATRIWDHNCTNLKIIDCIADSTIDIFFNEMTDSISNGMIRGNVCQDVYVGSGTGMIISENKCRGITLDYATEPYPNNFVVKGNHCSQTITIGSNCNYNSIVANATDTAIVNNGTGNVLSGNVVY